MELDALDRLAAQAFDGYIVRKDLALRFKGQYPVPTYVGEFLLGESHAKLPLDLRDDADDINRIESEVGPQVFLVANVRVGFTCVRLHQANECLTNRLAVLHDKSPISNFLLFGVKYQQVFV